MNKFKNPRLKHVKRIKKICSELEITGAMPGFLWQIIHQCNLLLETKKKKKCKCWCHTEYCFPVSSGKHCKSCKPSPQPEKCCDNGNFDDGHRCLKTPPSPQSEKCEHPHGFPKDHHLDGEVDQFSCPDCGMTSLECLGVKPSPQPEIEFYDYSPNPCLTKEQKIERVIRITFDEMVRKISYINKLTKTK